MTVIQSDSIGRYMVPGYRGDASTHLTFGKRHPQSPASVVLSPNFLRGYRQVSATR